MWNRYLVYKTNTKKTRRATLASSIVLGVSMMDNNKNAQKPYDEMIDNILKGVEF